MKPWTRGLLTTACLVIWFVVSAYTNWSVALAIVEKAGTQLHNNDFDDVNSMVTRTLLNAFNIRWTVLTLLAIMLICLWPPPDAPAQLRRKE